MKYVHALGLVALNILTLATLPGVARANGPTATEIQEQALLNLGEPLPDGRVPMPVWSDLRDIARYRPDLVPDAKILSDALNVSSNPLSQTLLAGGAKLAGTISMQDFPRVEGGKSEYTNVVGLMQGTDGKYFFRRVSVTVEGEAGHRHVTEASPKTEGSGTQAIPADIPLAQTHFEVNAGLVSRMVLLEDAYYDIGIVYPLGVGGVDPGLVYSGGTHILTPMFHGASIQRGNVIPKRTDPSYYRAMPFLAITNSKGVRTPIGFHITILSDQDWKTKGQNFLVRGFDSHGCMRLRAKDLNEFFTIVMNGGSATLPVNVDYFVYNRDHWSTNGRDRSAGLLPFIHPYPLNTQYFQTVTNVANPGEPPRAGRDPVEHLLLMNKAPGSPDLTHLADFSADEAEDLKLFENMDEAREPNPNLPLQRVLR